MDYDDDFRNPQFDGDDDCGEDVKSAPAMSVFITRNVHYKGADVESTMTVWIGEKTIEYAREYIRNNFFGWKILRVSYM